MRSGRRVERLASWRLPESLYQLEGNICVYGEPLFTGHVASSLGLTLLEPKLDWLTTLPETYVQRSIHAMTMGEARAWKERAFFKPADDKSFDAKVYENGTALPESADFPDDLPTLISEPVEWRSEFRCFVRERRVEAISPYCRHGEICKEEDGDYPFLNEEEGAAALEFAETLLSDQTVELSPAVVVDIGEIEGRGWAVIESNPAWASGLYASDPDGALRVIERACVRSTQLTKDDTPGAWRKPRAATD